MRINNNVSALNSWRNLYMNDTALTKSMEKLSSGFRINRAGDDAAGLAISEKMRAQISGLNMAIKNAQDGISLVQTAEGALNEQQVIIRRIRDLAIQAANATNTPEDVQKLQDEVTELISEIDRIASTTEFNSMPLLDGTFSGKQFHIGPNTGSQHRISVTIANMNASSLGINAIDFTASSVDFDTIIDDLTAALDQVSAERSKLGAYQNRLEHTINNLQIAAENLTAAESRIRDVDVALETTNFVKNQILVQAATAMLAQSNAKPQSVLQLLG